MKTGKHVRTYTKEVTISDVEFILDRFFDPLKYVLKAERHATDCRILRSEERKYDRCVRLLVEYSKPVRTGRVYRGYP